nr:hypothetical protein [Tanacetum cinerariifolium]
MPITTAKEKAQRRLEVKARSTLIISIPNEHQLKFNSIKDAKQLLEAVEKRFVNTTQAVNTANRVTTCSTQFNAAFSTNINNLSDVLICAFLASQPNNPQLAHEDLEQVYPNDMEDMDLRWQMAMLTMRDTRHAIKELRRKLEVAQKEKDVIQLTVEKLENASKSLNKLIDCQIVDNYKKGLGYESYNAVLPPYTGNFMPSKPDLSYTGLDKFAVKPVVDNKSSKEETKGNPQIDLQDKGVIDSGCSRHMKRNMSYLTYYKEIDGGYVAFRGNPK